MKQRARVAYLGAKQADNSHGSKIGERQLDPPLGRALAHTFSAKRILLVGKFQPCRVIQHRASLNLLAPPTMAAVAAVDIAALHFVRRSQHRHQSAPRLIHHRHTLFAPGALRRRGEGLLCQSPQCLRPREFRIVLRSNPLVEWD
jgi:hypothetical protein